jgi:uncharacterized RDD family membrane protein YckC
MKPASILKRIAAFLIDHAILTILLSIIGLFLTAVTPASNTALDAAKEFFDKAIQLIPGQEPALSAKISAKLVFLTTHMKSTITLCLILSFLYFVYFERSKWQATVGKKLLKLKVMNSENKRMSVLEASKRFILFATPAIIFHLLVFMGYPQCLTLHKHILTSGIVIPTACITLFSGYILTYLVWLLPIFFTKEIVTLYDALSKTKVKS